MTHKLWALLTWTPEYGAATTVIGVLGTATTAQGDTEVAIAWMPRTYHLADTWRTRLATTATDDLAAALELWELSRTDPAIAIDVAPTAPDLVTATHIQLDDLLAPGSA